MSLNKNELFCEIIDQTVRQLLQNKDELPEESEVKEQYETYFDLFKFLPEWSDITLDREATVNKLTDQYCMTLNVIKETGFAYSDEETKPWLNSVESEIGWFYWKRYKNFLLRDKKWSGAAVRSIEKDTEAILDLMANPQQESGFERRGLVVASVQSGKTANYTGLICRAADVGYRIIIVMAGVYNDLRNQTQARLEEGFTGFDIVGGQSIKQVGVGKTDSSRRPVSCTSREADFNKSRATALRGFQTDHTDEPWLFVIKKNSNSLRQVCEWLKAQANQNDQLLIIDDEADNASINRKYKKEHRKDEPTQINKQIREILKFFNRCCYVGYTATPFANILIDSTVDTENYGEDLFPKSFIYTLRDSTDYFGASKVFDDYDSSHPKYLRSIDDINLVLPPKHKSTYEINCLPESMKAAIRTFFLATTIRMIRNGDGFHSTMMINASPYKIPQHSISLKVEDYVEELKNATKAYGSLPAEMALSSSSSIKDLYATWEYEYKNSGLSWNQILSSLYAATHNVRIVNINSGTNDKLDYENQEERVIAVGGYRLSRGLTLEGLCVSYYSRNAKAYDALMQMARWFGYRPGYEDLCRIWMSPEAAEWYEFVTEATNNLFDELRSMYQSGRTPRDYGLRILRSPDSLTVTARNKMGAGQRMKAPVDLNNGFVETIAFDRDADAIATNTAAALLLIGKIKGYYLGEKNLFSNVPSELIINFLKDFKNEDSYSVKSQTNPVLEYIERRLADGELAYWDVYIAQGSKSDTASTLIELPVIGNIPRERRKPGMRTLSTCLFPSDKNRLASRGVEKNGLSPEQKAEAEQKFRKDHPEIKNISDRYYRRVRTKPLLVLHPIIICYENAEEYEKGHPASWPSAKYSEEVFGWSLSLPYTDKQEKPVEYIFNDVAIRNIGMEYEEEDSDDDYADE